LAVVSVSKDVSIDDDRNRFEDVCGKVLLFFDPVFDKLSDVFN
jgi:hypothetical protein